MSIEIERAVAESRDLTELERLSFGLDEMALSIRHWLAFTKSMRDREGLACGYYADVHFPMRPSYPQFEIWAKTMEESAAAIRSMAGAQTQKGPPAAEAEGGQAG